MSAAPKLRFAEFDGDWRPNKLSEVTQTITDGTHFSPETFDVGDYKYITSKNIRMGRMKLDDISYISAKDHEHIYSTCQVELGDVLLTKDGASTGNICLNELDEEFSLLSSVALIKADKAKTFNGYLYHYFVSPYGSREVKKSVAGQAITRITLTNLSNFKFRFPSLEEQKKVADFLGAVDDKIAGLRERKRLLTQYKKGVMQKIFSQALRFKADDGSDFPDWEPMVMADLFEITSSKRVFQEEWTTSGVPFYRTREIVKLIDDGYVDNDLFISRDMYADYRDKHGVPQLGDLLVTGVGTIGKVYLVDAKDEFYFKDGNVIWFKSRGVTNSDFVVQSFKSRAIRKQLSDGAAITTVATYTIDRANKTKISTPHPDEQQKIVDFLSAVDDKITAVSAQITQMQDFKKGLLQQMFV